MLAPHPGTLRWHGLPTGVPSSPVILFNFRIILKLFEIGLRNDGEIIKWVESGINPTPFVQATELEGINKKPCGLWVIPNATRFRR